MNTSLYYFILKRFNSTRWKWCFKRWFQHQMALAEFFKHPIPINKIGIQCAKHKDHTSTQLLTLLYRHMQ
jgi:hypothetical protein